MTSPSKKKFNSLISSMISGNKAKTEQLTQELVESILEEKEPFIMESIFKNLEVKGESDV